MLYCICSQYAHVAFLDRSYVYLFSAILRSFLFSEKSSVKSENIENIVCVFWGEFDQNGDYTTELSILSKLYVVLYCMCL